MGGANSMSGDTAPASAVTTNVNYTYGIDAAMGLTGGLGFDNTTGDVHESTAALLKKLIATTSK